MKTENKFCCRENEKLKKRTKERKDWMRIKEKLREKKHFIDCFF
jgi:hypothetical protein